MTLLLDVPLKTSLVPTTGSGSASFTRATSKTFINSSDVAETVTSGNPALHSEKGALIDPASKTNTMLHCRTIGASATTDPSSSAKWISSTTGSNAVTNSFFDTDTNGWIGSNTTLSLDANRLKILTLASGASPYARTIMSTEIGVRYVVSLDYVEDAVVGNLYCYIRNTLGVALIVYNTQSTLGTHKFAFTAVETTTYLNISFASGSVAGGHVIVDNVTCYPAGVNSTLTGTGIDGAANSCALLEFVENGATILQTITAAAAAGCSGFWVKWHTAVGTVEITRDNVTWVDITDELSTDAFYVAKIENTSVTNPVVGFRGSNGVKIIVDAGLNHLGTALCEPIFTTTASVTRNAEVLTYQTSGNFSDTAGTILATFTPLYPGSWPSGAVVGKSGSGLLISDSNSGVQAADGTNTVNGATGAPANSSIRIGCRWSGSSLEAFSADPLLNVGTAGSYDGSFNLSTIAINPGAAGYIKDVKVYDASLTNAEIKTAWGLLDSQTFLPAFSNLPIYNAGAIIHVDPDPDPEPTPAFATDFTGWTVGANGVENPQYFVGTWACVFQFTGSDSATGFSVPTAAPVYAMPGAGSWGTGLGLQNINTDSSGNYFHYSANTKAGVAGRFTHDIIDTTVRGVATKGLEIKIPSPGVASEFIQQAWFQIYRDVDQPDLTEFTTRFEVKLPDLSVVLPYTPLNGRLIILDYKSGSVAGGDFRYLVQVTRYGVNSYRWWLNIDNRGNRAHTSVIFCDMINNIEEVPQLENFTFEFSVKRANAYDTTSGVNAGKARVRIRRESDSDTTWRTVFDASESGIAAYSAINGSNNHDTSFGVSTRTNRHMGYYGDKMQRLMHGNYARKLAADCTVVLQKFRIHNSFNV